MAAFCDLFLSFTIYSFLGWVCETIYCSIIFKKFVNRGFLNGPFCPVYGFGAILLLYILKPLPKNALLVFFAGVVITTALEYITACILEKLFHAKWWDYSKNKFNYKGRICLLNSTLFGLLSVALIFFIEPVTVWLINLMSQRVKYVLFALLAMYFIVDTTITVTSIYKLNLRLEALSRAFSAIKEKLDNTDFYNALNIKERLEKLHELLNTDRGRAIYNSIESIRSYIRKLETENHAFQKRIIKAFPSMRSTKYPEVLNIIKEKVLRGKNTASDKSSKEQGTRSK